MEEIEREGGGTVCVKGGRERERERERERKRERESVRERERERKRERESVREREREREREKMRDPSVQSEDFKQQEEGNKEVYTSHSLYLMSWNPQINIEPIYKIY